MFKVFYLVGGFANFVCKSVNGIFSFENAQKEVSELERMGYKSMAVKNGHMIGGYCSFSDFEDASKAKEYYQSL
jgi:hypothetical protein